VELVSPYFPSVLFVFFYFSTKLETFQNDDLSSDNENGPTTSLAAEPAPAASAAVAVTSSVTIKPAPNADKPLLR
jgi:hypothetical protein